MTITALALSTSVAAQLHPNIYNWNNIISTPMAAKPAPVVQVADEPVMIAEITPSVTIKDAVKTAVIKPAVVSTKPQTSVSYTGSNNGIFGHNPYGYTDPRWVMAEMMNFMY